MVERVGDLFEMFKRESDRGGEGGLNGVKVANVKVSLRQTS